VRFLDIHAMIPMICESLPLDYPQNGVWKTFKPGDRFEAEEGHDVLFETIGRARRVALNPEPLPLNEAVAEGVGEQVDEAIADGLMAQKRRRTRGK
jgi:hypothetical protein